MDMTAVKSKSITEVGYEESTGEMHVKFASGHTYRYKGVSPEAHKAFVGAESIGSHFHKQIRSQFAGEKV